MVSIKEYARDFLNRLRQSSLAKDSFWAVLGSVIGKGLALVAGILIARFLGKEIYGEYGLLKNTLVYLAIVSTFGFGYTATKYVAEYKEDNNPNLGWLIRRIELFTIFISFPITLVLILFAEPVATFIKAPDLEIIFRKYGIIIVFNAITSTQVGIISGLKLFKVNAKVNCYTGIALFIASFLFTYIGGLDGAVLALLVSYVIQTLFNEFYIRRFLGDSINQGNGTRGEFCSMLSFSLPIALQEGLYIIVQWLISFLLIKYADYGEVGLASAAATWASIVIFIPGMLKNVMFSYLTTSGNHEHLVNRLLLFNFVSTIVPVTLMIVFAKVICSFYGSTFTGLIPVLIVALVSAVFTSISEVYCYDFISKGKPWIVFIARLVRDIFILFVGWIVMIEVNSFYAMYLGIVGLVANSIFFVILASVYKVRKLKYAK